MTEGHSQPTPPPSPAAPQKPGVGQHEFETHLPFEGDHLAVTLRASEMAALLHLARLSPTAISPLLGVHPTPPEAATLEALTREGWLDPLHAYRLRPAAALALGTVAAPQIRLRALLGDAHGLRTFDLYSVGPPPPAPPLWVRWETPRDAAPRAPFKSPLSAEGLPPHDAAQCEFFLDTPTVLERIARTLDLHSGFHRPPFSVRWEWDRFQVLVGLLDVFRATCLRTILEHSRASSPPFRANDILEALKVGLARPHNYWMTSLGNLLAPAPINLTAERIRKILEQLCEERFLHAAGDERFRVGNTLTDVAMSLLLVPAFVALTVGDELEEPVSHTAYIRGVDCLWRIEFEPLEPWDVEIKAIDSNAAHCAMRTDLTTRRACEADCKHCHQPLPSEARFCMHCGARRHDA